MAAGMDNWQRPRSDAEARSIIIGELPRAQRLGYLEAWYDGCAYSVGLNARPYSWEQEVDERTKKRIPLDQRRPKVYNLARHIVDTSTALLFGEGKAPVVHAERDEITSNWLSAIAEAIELQSVMLQVAKCGGSCGTAVLIGKAVEGYLRTELIEAKYAHPTFGPDGKSLTFLRYQFKAPASLLMDMGYEHLDPDKDYWYRCDYTPMAEVHYLPVEVSERGDAPVFVVDQARTIKHGLGVLAAVWIKNLPTKDPLDGEASYAGVLDLLHEVNMLVSIAPRSIRKLSDPTLAYTNVPGDAELPEQQRIGSSSGGSIVAPGDVKLLEMDGSGQEAALTWVDRLRQAIAEVSRVVANDPEKMTGGAQSAAALKLLMGPTLDLVTELRLSYGPAVQRFMRLMLELVIAVNTKEGPNGERYTVYLPREVEGEPNPRATLALKWGEIIKLTPADLKAEIENLIALVAARLMSQETAQARIARLYGIEDVAEERKRIEAERGQDPEHAMSEALATLQQMANNMPQRADEAGEDE